MCTSSRGRAGTPFLGLSQIQNFIFTPEFSFYLVCLENDLSPKPLAAPSDKAAGLPGARAAVLGLQGRTRRVGARPQLQRQNVRDLPLACATPSVVRSTRHREASD